MSSALYRKYRPQVFADVVGQAAVKLTLQNEITMKRPGHAYVFSGPRGVGKTTLARIFAKSLNCSERKEDNSEPCGVCLSCVDITEGRHPDVVEIDAASHTGVDHVRSAIIEYARFAPQRGGYKVFIIDEVHMLSTSAFNALLKTLEEPPKNVVFILATTELHKLPETILSRCERFDFKTIHPSKIAERLAFISEREGITVDAEVLRQIGVRSGGYQRDAESMLGQVLGLGKNVITTEDASLVLPKGHFDAVRELVGSLFRCDARGCVEQIMKNHEEGVDLRALLIDVTSALREIVLFQVGEVRTPLFDDYFGREGSEQYLSLFQFQPVSYTLLALDHCVAVFEYFRHPIPEYVILELALLKTIVGKTDSAASHANVERAARPVHQIQPKESASTVSLDQMTVRSKWDAFVEACVLLNPSLKLILDSAEPGSAEDGVIHIGVGYDLHVQKLTDAKTLMVIESALRQVYGQPLRLKVERTEVKKVEGAVGTQQDTLIDDLVKNFGGAG